MYFSLTNMEKDILELLWEKKCWMSGADFWDYFNQQGLNFKRQTVNTYLTRMTQKGFLVKNKTKYIYAYTREEFEEKRASEILNTMYEGSLKKFITALTGNVKITPEEAAELKDYLDNLE